MAQVLSQEEVDALLQGIAKEEVPTGSSQLDPIPVKGKAQPTPNDVKPYDFTRSEISSRWRLPGSTALVLCSRRRTRTRALTWINAVIRRRGWCSLGRSGS